MAEFGIHRLEAKVDVVDVFGRMYTGILKRGDAFRVLLPERVAVRLVVEQINAYRRDLDEIEEGLTARLSLRGEGGDLLAPGTVLGTE